ncbi:MAG: hypothetical protein KAU62_02565 [Candidatus Heimdallarchaeota archaeon]|nr:hypothetical protein [Candidatus Heimdallarchaeota archaeon]MCK4610019.1 hypothetical protein [Candidatus Heimdallarchaeota archaeon]
MKEVTFNEKNKELNIFDVFCTYVNDYKIVYAKDIKNRYLQRFYKQFSKKLPDHPDETRDFFLYTFSKNLDWITVYFVCSHFECGSSDYIAKLLKICKKIERKAQAHTEIIYLSFPYEVLILGWLAVLETIHREDYKFGEKMTKEKEKKELKKYPPGEATVEGVTKIMLPKPVEIEDAHKVFTKQHSVRNAMFSDITLVKSFGSEIPRLNWFQKFLRWLKG